MRKIVGLLGFLVGLTGSTPIQAKDRVCFTPAEECQGLAIDAINSAQKSIEVQQYHITNQRVIAAIVRARLRGLYVTVLIDKTAKKEAIPFLNVSIPVYIDSTVSIAHNKVIIIDDKLVIAGSYNMTESAEYRNAENMLLLDDPELVMKYVVNFEDRRSKSTFFLDYPYPGNNRRN